MRVGVLGPVVLADGPVLRGIPSERQRHLLAALAMRANETLSAGALIDATWGNDAPATARHALQVHVSSLRQLLAPTGVPLATRPQGYALALSGDQLDADLFERRAAQGRAALASGEPEAALGHLDDALALWRGDVLADVNWERFADAGVRRLEELRQSAREDRVDALLALGRSGDAVAEAEALAAAEPLRERRWCQLLVALYRAGRQVDALRRAHEVRRTFAEEFGVDASQQLQAIEAAILAHDASLGLPAPAATGPPVTRFVKVDGLHVAYQTVGDSDSEHHLMMVPGMTSHIEVRWENPKLAAFYGRLARSARLVMMDKVGTGLSDRVTGPYSLSQQVDCAVAVLDRVGAERATFFGIYDGAAVALLAAATHPDRVAGIVTYAASAAPSAADFPAATPPELRAAVRAAVMDDFSLEDVIDLWAPSEAHDPVFTQWFSRYVRMAVGLGDVPTLYDEMNAVDVRRILPEVHCPVLVLHRRDDRLVPSANAEWLAAHLPDARAVVVAGKDSVIWAGDVDRLAQEMESFLRWITASASGPARHAGRRRRTRRPAP